jgi:F-type H+-transporting ATPase subunit a
VDGDHDRRASRLWRAAPRRAVPGRWQMAVEGLTGFIDSLLAANVGPNGKKYVPYIFSLFMFILFANILGLLPLGLVGVHPFTSPATSR